MANQDDAKEVLDAPLVTESNTEPGLVLASEVLPNIIPILPVRLRPYFPGFTAPIAVSGEQLDLIKQLIEDPDQTVGLLLVKDLDLPDSPDNIHMIGVAAKIMKAVQAETEVAHILLNCLERFTIRELFKSEKGWRASVDYFQAVDQESNEELRAYSIALVSTLKELVQLDPLQSEAIKLFLSRSDLENPGRLADFSASLTTANAKDLQDVLETFDLRKRLDKVLLLLKKELEVTKLKQKITDQIDQKMSEHQREFFLKEQLKAIKQELGLEKDGRVSEIEKFQERLSSLTLPEEAKNVADSELEKLRLIDKNSPEYAVSRNYLEWLTTLPWGRFSKDSYHLGSARTILDSAHYGLEDVKDRIIEFIAVGKLKGDISGSILCLVGPPGVGKTSIGRSIAEALNRQFYRFSLGGMRDEAEIKGHRLTYIGAMPGKFIQALKTVGTANPVIMLDEVDKIGASYQGDPASALLEVLDPEQNVAFRDHYLDVPFDLSNVLFIATANQLDTIPLPLLDRMELIRLSGYILEEKLEIGKRHLMPKTLKNHGLTSKQVRITKAAMSSIIDGYAREAGVRGLEKQIKKILRKSAVLLTKGESSVTVGLKRVSEFLGDPFFPPEKKRGLGPGVVRGLAWTSLGGAVLLVEATAVASKRHGFKQTGQLGEVMVESSEIAYSYVMSESKNYGTSPDFFDTHFVHLHVPAGATPKDGPSAGITMATALISMLTHRPAHRNLAMSGELTLTGQVLAVGGIKEKVIAAKRAGCRTLIFPADNRGDFNQLPHYLIENIDVHFAENLQQVIDLAFQK